VEECQMNKWFLNMLLATGIGILLLWLDINTNILNYGLDSITLLIIILLVWIISNQLDILNQTKEIKK